MPYNLSRGQIRLAGIRANKGDAEAQAFLVDAFTDYRGSVNRSIRGLRRGGYTYGHGYKYISEYVSGEWGNRVLIPELKKFNDDWKSIANAVNHMVKFSEYADSTVEKAKALEQKRMDAIREKGLVPPDVSDRRLKNFMRFLGWEETRAIIDLYGDSNELVEIIWEAYAKKGNSKSKMAKVFADFLEEYESREYHDVDITDYFAKIGIPKKRW